MKGFYFLSLLILYIFAKKIDVEEVQIHVDRRVFHKVRDEFLSVAIDFAKIIGFHDEGHYHQKIDFENEYLLKLTRGLNEIQPMFIRMGGGPGDCIVYLNETSISDYISEYCKKKLYKGLLSSEDFEKIIRFSESTKSSLIFGLNAAYKRGYSSDKYIPWNSQNSEILMKWLIANGLEKSIIAFELGNEPRKEKFGRDIDGKDYANDFHILSELIKRVYKQSTFSPLIIGPDTQKASEEWVQNFITSSEQYVDAFSYHYYICSQATLSQVIDPSNFQKLKQQSDIFQEKNEKEVWFGEGTCCSDGGTPNVSDSFAGSLWYASQLGLLASLNNKVVIRQSLIGANYGLLNYRDYKPNPDFFIALFWKRNMRNLVFLTNSSSKDVFAFSHSSDDFDYGMVIINFSNSKKNLNFFFGERKNKKSRFEEYHLTASSLESKILLVNGVEARIGNKTDPYYIPEFNPIVRESQNMIINGFSIVFLNIKFH